MKILVIDFAAKSGGAKSIIEDFYNEIKDDSNNDYVFLLSNKFFQETKRIKIDIVKEKGKISRLLFDYYSCKKYVKKVNPDIIISFQNTMVNVKGIKKVLYIHQSIPFQETKKFSFFKPKELKLAIIQHIIGYFIKKSVKKSDKIIVQTKWMKKAIVNQVKISPNKIIVITPKFDVSIKNQANNINNFFYPGYREIYKNIETIEKAVNLLKNDGYHDFNVEITTDGISDDNIFYIGRISRKDVMNKYCSKVLIFPSYIESFALPLIEARNCNTIILAAKTDFSLEVLDGYNNTYYFDPFDYNKLALLMKEVIEKKIILNSKSSGFKNNNSTTILDVLEEGNYD